jgi:hypothetical protein
MSFAGQAASAASRWPRRVMPEILDELPADDPRAIRSRGDLRRINRIMGARGLLVRALDVAGAPPRTLVEIGSGDGSMALRIARSRARRWPGVKLTLLDRTPSVTPQTCDAIRALGWEVEVLAADVLDWLEQPAAAPVDRAFANLFVHHFESERLARLLAGLAARCGSFVCCEPRRSLLALGGGYSLALIGCNQVTRHDAVVSVRAGFRQHELSDAWRGASSGRWRLHEMAAGLFSHMFVASREP